MRTTLERSNGIEILFSDSSGIYIPQRFAQECPIGTEPGTWHGVSQENAEILLAGPEHDEYWDAWDTVLSEAKFIDEQGKTWTLHQDGDCFAVCLECMDNETYSDFFGEMKPAPDDAYEYEVCGNCLIALANDDYSGMEEEEEKATKNGLAALHQQYKLVITDGAEYGFSRNRCECCNALPGDRYRVLCFDKIEETE